MNDPVPSSDDAAARGLGSGSRPPRLKYAGFQRRSRRAGAKRIVPFRQIVPSAITTTSLCAGLASIHFAMQGDFDRALFAIALSAVFDTFDGLAARLLKAQTPFGAVLDSLSDLVCFGVAPALLLHQWMGKAPGVDPAFKLGALLVFVLCAALRLARFTAAPRSGAAPTHAAQAPAALSKFFTGMPTPAAAACVLVPPMLDQSRIITYALPTWAVVLNTFVIAWLMISRVPMYALKQARVRRKHVPLLMVGVGLLVVAMVRDVWLTLSALAGLYLLSISLSLAAYRRLKRAPTSVSQASVRTG
ncbi:MAG: CDP-alcohol phosphatidyltransferase family protein [Phycisphaerales bacterium]